MQEKNKDKSGAMSQTTKKHEELTLCSRKWSCSMSTVGGRPSALLKQRTVVVTLGDLTGTVIGDVASDFGFK